MNEFDLFKDKKKVLALREKIPAEHSIEALAKALRFAVKERASSLKKCAVLFSGGVDSSLMALALKDFTEPILYCAGTGNSKVFPRARKNAKLLGLKLREVPIKEADFPKLKKETVSIIGTDEKMQVSIALPVLAALKAVKSDGIETVFSGTGADELFCGYREFSTVLKQKGYMAVELLCWSKLDEMFGRNLKREIALLGNVSLNAFDPFLDERFVLEAMAFPAEEKILSPEDELRKIPLRELAKFMGLPESICLEKKKAIQFDSGSAKELSRLAKQN